MEPAQEVVGLRKPAPAAEADPVLDADARAIGVTQARAELGLGEDRGDVPPQPLGTARVPQLRQQEGKREAEHDHAGGHGRREDAPPRDPLAQEEPPRRRPRCDRLPFAAPTEVLGELERARVPPRGVLLERLERDDFQVLRDAGVKAARGNGIIVHDPAEELNCGRPSERRHAGQPLVEHGPERVHVGPRGDVAEAALDLLGGHVLGRAEDLAAPGQPRVLPAQVRQPEVRDLGLPLGGEEDVGGLQVAVDDPAFVGRLDAAGHLLEDLRRRRPQGPAGDELHDEVVGPGVEDADHVRVRELRHDLGLATEPSAPLVVGGPVFREELHGDVAAERAVERSVDDGHSASPQHLDQAIAIGDGRRTALPARSKPVRPRLVTGQSRAACHPAPLRGPTPLRRRASGGGPSRRTIPGRPLARRGPGSRPPPSSCPGSRDDGTSAPPRSWPPPRCPGRRTSACDRRCRSPGR